MSTAAAAAAAAARLGVSSSRISIARQVGPRVRQRCCLLQAHVGSRLRLHFRRPFTLAFRSRLMAHQAWSVSRNGSIPTSPYQ